ncbi:hypothetical protein V511_10420 [Mesotoga sp. Brook.08.YT.4.2.5.1]|nr:hypothetical protein V511_10420 [Mesotoga sp. Brook.08.YT.4.2.5.1]RAO96689.1 hypothetical protein M388_13005 [Mesotoga sp. Brook.08.YT.4.2.5.4.]RDI93368.1 hypothetical protein Q502_06065 [Mesotoga sp. Brook.08.YT.4.2.5.2.]
MHQEMTPNRSPEQNIFRAGFIGAGFLGQALRDDSLFLLWSSWHTTGQDLDLWCEKDKQLQIIRARPINSISLLKCSSRSVDGGPLTDNVVFVSDQRVHRF